MTRYFKNIMIGILALCLSQNSMASSRTLTSTVPAATLRLLQQNPDLKSLLEIADVTFPKTEMKKVRRWIRSRKIMMKKRFRLTKKVQSSPPFSRTINFKIHTDFRLSVNGQVYDIPKMTLLTLLKKYEKNQKGGKKRRVMNSLIFSKASAQDWPQETPTNWQPLISGPDEELSALVAVYAILWSAFQVALSFTTEKNAGQSSCVDQNFRVLTYKEHNDRNSQSTHIYLSPKIATALTGKDIKECNTETQKLLFSALGPISLNSIEERIEVLPASDQ